MSQLNAPTLVSRTLWSTEKQIRRLRWQLGRRWGRAEWAQASLRIVAPAIVPLAALFVSWQAFTVSRETLRLASDPLEVDLQLPERVRLEFDPTFTVVYIQPTFTLAKVSARAEQMYPIRLEVQRDGDDASQTKPFEWWRVVQFGFNKQTNQEYFKDYVSDALPVVVSLARPAAPMAEFHGPENFRFSADDCYSLTVIADRTANPDAPAIRKTVWIRILSTTWQALVTGSGSAVAANKPGEIPIEFADQVDRFKCPALASNM